MANNPSQVDGNDRTRYESPPPTIQGTPPAPGAPRRQIRRPRTNPDDVVLPDGALNLSDAFNNAARQQAEDDDFRANQTGDEHQVPNSPSVSDYEDDDDDEF